MLTKFETKSNRIKGLAFHTTRPWILASLHNGVVQLWDYRIRTLIDKFDEHDGPVRGVCFHNSQPLFVSGGDDYKIKVWNYRQRRCLFTLLGHLDYIRTVEFHKESPWILSSSDDQTIRIWNWQSRTCISVLTGHNHYVMCAAFHPKDDLVVSASLDQTVRVWDISGLRKKSMTVKPFVDDSMRLQNDLFGNTDAVVKYVMEGHDRGVNWVAFHPSKPLIVSGADDRTIKLWRTDDNKAWEVDTFRGHFHNISCVIFHPRQELILSNSEDRTLRLWSLTNRTLVSTFRRENDRFWILTAHPELNLFAAGHDSGMIIFKLERERPTFTVYNNEKVLYVKDKYLRSYEFANGKDTPVLTVRRTNGKVQQMSYSAQDKAVLISTDADGGSYDLYLIPKDGRTDATDSKRGTGGHAVFVGRDRFAVLDKTSQIIVKDMKNDEVKRCPLPFTADMMFAAPTGSVLIRGEDRVAMYDVQQRKVTAELMCPPVKYAIWAANSSYVALIGRDHIVVANRKLEQQCSISETIRIKGGAWDENGVFIYTTLNHIKYCLPNGDNGVVRTLDAPVYVTCIKGNRMHCLDREIKNRVISVDPTEYRFKHALIEKRYADVLKMVKASQLIGTSIISYLHKKGFPEIALHFVQDERTRFSLALECGNIEIALESARVLNDKDCWHNLGVAALRQGNHQIVETAYQHTKNFERLSFLYLITGNIDKLKKMLKISEMRGDVMGRFQNSLFLGDVEDRINILNQSGLSPLAYITAATHGLPTEALAERLHAAAAEGVAEDEEPQPADLPQVLPNAKLLFPPTPIMRVHESNWPLLTVSKAATFINKNEDNKFNLSVDVEDVGGWDAGEALDPSDQTEELSPWGGQEDIGLDDEEGVGASADIGGEGWDVGELEGLDKIDDKPASKGHEFWVAPNPGPGFAQVWCRNSNLAADHAAAGSFESAMQLLHTQVGAVNFTPLKSIFLQLFMGSRSSLACSSATPSLLLGVQRNAAEFTTVKSRAAGLPVTPVTLASLVERLKAGYASVTSGKFSDALVHFQYIMHNLLLVIVDTKSEVQEAKELLSICREYVTGVRLEITRKELSQGPTAVESAVRQAELAAYFTHCNIQPPHLMLSLRSAMLCAHKIKNYLHAASFGKRLIEINPPADFATQARKVVKFAETNSRNENSLDYDERNPFVVCGLSFKPIYKGSALIRCPYCAATFLPEHSGKVCPTCQISQIGKEASGLQVLPSK
eukprot:TRINITY_DN5593_c0_g1_i1.p1 TRINITY_DN5593_c0_g1~~TRINITY_DN5593_c0_g1_i1.p1  ORF type:complete len:1233 (-),score=305.98 TRINITY_DN5593_c0_g1_i1:20-3718(-)